MWFLFFVLGLWAVALQMPAKPGPNDFLADYANVITVDQTRKQMQSDLRSWNAKGKTRVFVVTISNLAGYGLSDVESGAKGWFEIWGLDSDDILFLYSVGDRKAKIQLGSEWDETSRAKADQILRDVVVPPSLHGDYSLAVYRGANAVHHLAEEPKGPGASTGSISEKLDRGIARSLPYCSLSGMMTLVMFLGGAMLLLLGLAGIPQFIGRPAMIGLSLTVFLATAFSSLVLPILGVTALVALAMIMPSHHHHCHSWFGWGDSHDGWFGGCSSWFGGGHHHHHHSSWGGGCSDWW
ncbi:TPM domain-containing protein [bacterium]|nr:TPM domain-containing protein [bacterium]